MSSRRLAAAILCAASTLLYANAAHAVDAFWHGVRSDVWGDGIAGGVSNWYSEAPPMGVARPVPDGTAIFAKDALRFGIVINKNTQVGRMRFTADAPQYSFIVARDKKFTLNGLGISNQSNTAPAFKVIGMAGDIRLVGTARMVGGTAPAAKITTADRGALYFDDTTRGGNAQVINTTEGSTIFNNRASAEQMDIINRSGGFTIFNNQATGATASIFNGIEGELDCTPALGPAGDKRLPMGQLENRGGRVLLGRTNLDLTRTFSQNTDGRLLVTVSSKTDFGSIKTGQGAKVGGRLVVASDGAKPGMYKIVSAGGARTGRFDSVILTGAPTLKARLAYSAKEVTLILEKK